MASAPRPSTPNPLRQALGACRSAIIATAGFSFVGNLLLFVAPLYMLQVYDRVLGSHSGATLLMLSLIAGFLLAILGLVEMLRSKVLVRAGARIDLMIAGKAFTGVFAANLRNEGSGGAQVLRDIDTVRDFATGPALLVFCDAPWAPLFVIAAFLLHPLIGLVTLLGGVVIFALAMANEMVTRKAVKQASAVTVDAAAFAEASLRNAEVLHAMGMLPAIARRWLARHHAVLALQSQAADRGGSLQAASKVVRMVLQSGILGLGAWLAIDDQVTGGSIIAGSIVLGRALAPVEMLVGHWKGFIAARAAVSRLNAALAAADAHGPRMALPRPTGKLAVERAFVVPPGSRSAVLKGVSFGLEPGEALGVVGPSAAGKSTLARLLVGVWPPGAGLVRIDGADMASWDRQDLGPAIGYLPQDVELFDGTVAENIARFGTIDAAKVVAAARQAGVHEVILGLADGYDTRIGVGGGRLSGGQRQRIALARALYDDPALVILDEPNSNLDALGEQALLEAVVALKARKATTVVVTHRLSVLGCLDKILVLNAGEVEMFGSRDEVMARLARPQVIAGQRQGNPAAAQGMAAQGAMSRPAAASATQAQR